MGDTLYVSTYPNGTIGGVPISYEEAIGVSINYSYKPQYILASRNNYKSGQTVWNTEYKLPFEVLTDTQKNIPCLTVPLIYGSTTYISYTIAENKKIIHSI